MSDIFKGVKAVVFDLDGTLYYGNSIAEGAIETVQYLKDNGYKVFYLSNNSSRTRKQILEKLVGFGFKADLSEVYNASYAAGIYLKSAHLTNVHCMGTEDLKTELRNHGLTVTDGEEKADAVLVGLDQGFNYEKLSNALTVYRKGSKLIACNPDKYFPVENFKIVPGCGAIVSALETACDAKIDFLIGKPKTFMLELIVEDWKFTKEEILVVGDSYENDIKLAQNYGCKSIMISQSIRYKDVNSINEIGELVKTAGD